jgi:hypothetical protein
VSDEHAIVIGEPVDGTFPISAVTADDTLTLSILYDQFLPDEGPGQPWQSASGADLTFAIRTFWPQRRIVSELLVQAAGVKPDAISTIMNPDILRRPCTLGALQMIYTALAAAASEPANFLVRAELYERLYRRALRNAAVDLDLDGDGVIDTRRHLGVLELHRS